MWWLIVIIVIIAALVFPQFRKVLLIFAAIAGIGIVLLIANHKQEQNASKSRISVQQIELSELKLISDYGTSYKLIGRVKNLSPQYTLTSFDMRITARDCHAQGQCETVGDTTAHVYESVPTGQSRALDEHVYFSGMPGIKGRFEWNYAITDVSGK